MPQPRLVAQPPGGEPVGLRRLSCSASCGHERSRVRTSHDARRGRRSHRAWSHSRSQVLSLAPATSSVCSRCSSHSVRRKSSPMRRLPRSSWSPTLPCIRPTPTSSGLRHAVAQSAHQDHEPQGAHTPRPMAESGWFTSMPREPSGEPPIDGNRIGPRVDRPVLATACDALQRRAGR
jgi:hypothetical protein